MFIVMEILWDGVVSVFEVDGQLMAERLLFLLAAE